MNVGMSYNVLESDVVDGVVTLHSLLMFITCRLGHVLLNVVYGCDYNWFDCIDDSGGVTQYCMYSPSFFYL